MDDFEPHGWGMFMICSGAAFLAGAIFGLVVGTLS